MLDEAGMWPVHQKKFLKTVPHSLKKKKKQSEQERNANTETNTAPRKEETILLKHTAFPAPMKRVACAPETEEFMCWV